MILPCTKCIIAKSAFAFGLFSVQQPCWLLSGIKFCVYLCGLLSKLCPFPSSRSSSRTSILWPQDSPAYAGAPPLLCFASAVASRCPRLCQVRRSCFSFPFQESRSGALCSLREEAKRPPSSAPATTCLRGLHLTQGTASEAGTVWGGPAENTSF